MPNNVDDASPSKFIKEHLAMYTQFEGSDGRARFSDGRANALPWLPLATPMLTPLNQLTKISTMFFLFKMTSWGL